MENKTIKKRTHTKESIQNKLDILFGANNYILIDYKGYDILSNFHCNKCNHDYQAVPHTAIRNNLNGLCPFCTITTKNVTEEQLRYKIYNEDNNYELISFDDGYSKGFKIKHLECGNIFKTTGVYYFKMKHRCPKCSHQSYKYTNDEVYNKINNITNGEYELVSDYKNGSTKISILHKKCNKSHDYILKNFIYHENRCPYCYASNRSKVLEKIINYIENNNLVYEQEKKFSECKDKRQLPFDIYIPSGNIIIEYDGSQHFFPRRNDQVNSDFGDRYYTRKKHDNIKNEFCNKNGIKLLRIPYTVKIESINKIIDELLNSNFNLSSTTIEQNNLYFNDTTIKYYLNINKDYYKVE